MTAERNREEYLAKNKGKSKKKNALSIVLLIFGILLTAAGIGVFFLVKKYKIYGISCAAAGVLLFAAALIRNANMRKKRNLLEYESADEDLKKFKQENQLSERPDESYDYDDLRRNCKEKIAEYNRLFAEISKIEDAVYEADETLKNMEIIKEMKVDAENIGKTLALIKEISKEKQIIYFCCHESRKLAI